MCYCTGASTNYGSSVEFWFLHQLNEKIDLCFMVIVIDSSAKENVNRIMLL